MSALSRWSEPCSQSICFYVTNTRSPAINPLLHSQALSLQLHMIRLSAKWSNYSFSADSILIWSQMLTDQRHYQHWLTIEGYNKSISTSLFHNLTSTTQSLIVLLAVMLWPFRCINRAERLYPWIKQYVSIQSSWSCIWVQWMCLQTGLITKPSWH